MINYAGARSRSQSGSTRKFNVERSWFDLFLDVNISIYGKSLSISNAYTTYSVQFKTLMKKETETAKYQYLAEAGALNYYFCDFGEKLCKDVGATAKCQFLVAFYFKTCGFLNWQT